MKTTAKPAAPKSRRGKYKFHIKRVYDEPSAGDGLRFLVDRLWPRGVKKTALPLTEWMKNVAPSPALRTWFGHEEAKLAEFRKRYRAELEKNSPAWKPLIEAIRKDNVTLLFAARDMTVNHAAILKEFLEEKSRG